MKCHIKKIFEYQIFLNSTLVSSTLNLFQLSVLYFSRLLICLFCSQYMCKQKCKSRWWLGNDATTSCQINSQTYTLHVRQLYFIWCTRAVDNFSQTAKERLSRGSSSFLKQAGWCQSWWLQYVDQRWEFGFVHNLNIIRIICAYLQKKYI